MEDENRLIQERMRKLHEIKEKGINPYPYSYDKKHNSKELKEKFDSKLKPEEKSNSKAKIAGRIMTIRKMGKASFVIIQDMSGKIQLYLNQDILGKEKYKFLKKLDIGDIVGAEGIIFKTKTGEVTVEVKKYDILTKSLKPLPEKFHGITDKELRYRNRSVDLIMNQDVMKVFIQRSKIIASIREFMAKKGFMEVETPVLQTQYGGANARPFITHINEWNMDMYLSISPELFLKRLIVGGFEKIFTICKNFRNEGVDASHNPEFTMLEVYQSYVDYNDMMKLYEEAVEYACLKVLGTTKVTSNYKGNEVELDFKAPWTRLSMLDSINKYAEIDVSTMDTQQIREIVLDNNIEIEDSKNFTWGEGVSLLFEELVEDKLIQPVHIIDHPKESTPLCKVHRQDQRLIERFESFCMGCEMCNAYSELNDPILQHKLLKEQSDKLRAGSEEAHPMDNDFVNAIETGMPPTGGLGFGIDRLAILLTGVESIRDVILFPTMKPIEEEPDKKQKKKK